MTILKVIAAITAALAVILVVSYWSAGHSRLLLDDQIRAKLQSQGHAYSFVTLTDGTVHYRLEGPKDGPLVVLIHGFSLPSFIWAPYIEPLTRAGYQVLVYDNYGRGFSDRPDTAYNADLFDRQLEELLGAVAPDTQVDLLGYSMGGAIATIFAARHPLQVRSLILMAPAGLGVADNSRTDWITRPLIGDWFIRMFGLKLFHDRAAEASRSTENPANFLAQSDRQMEYRHYGDALLSTLRHYPLTGAEKAYAEAGTSSRPVMVIWGEADSTVPFSNAKRLMELMPHAKLYSYPKIGHEIGTSQTGLVVQRLIDFLNARQDQPTGAEPPAFRVLPRVQPTAN